MGTFTGWESPYDWQQDREFADVLVDPLEAADQARKRDKELAGEGAELSGPKDGSLGKTRSEVRSAITSEPASAPTVEFAAALARLQFGDYEVRP